MVCFDNVSKFILSGITMHIPEGLTVGLIGRSGAGKTTFLKLVCGLLVPDSGNVYTMGKSMAEGRRLSCPRIGVLFTDRPVLNSEDTVRENFELAAAAYRLPDRSFRRDYSELSWRLGFAGFEGKQVRSLSLGQRRRAELGAVLLHRPALLLLDEPDTGLDELAKLEFRALLEERKRDEKMTVAVSSHDMAEISGLCDRIAFLHKGRLLFYGEKDNLRRCFLPREELVLRVRGRMPDLEDLPLIRYSIEGETLRMIYRSDFITAPQILQFILPGCQVDKINVYRPGLENIIEEFTGMSLAGNTAAGSRQGRD